MKRSVLDNKVLVLNKGWVPINVTNAFEAVCKLFNEKAKVVDKNYGVFTLDQWIENWSDASKIMEVAEERKINCVNFVIPAPEVIVLTDYNGFKVKRAKLSRVAIFTRDQYTCQYCGKGFPTKKLNIDHVHPKSRGGKSTWENLVLSCFTCNTRKGNRTPKEAGMKLLSKPSEPHWSLLHGKKLHNTKVPKSWTEFLGDVYWNVALED
jgi:5-methylcytosine-specific restriction endonuclease McrA